MTAPNANASTEDPRTVIAAATRLRLVVDICTVALVLVSVGWAMLIAGRSVFPRRRLSS
jgi:hypothetical protein